MVKGNYNKDCQRYFTLERENLFLLLIISFSISYRATNKSGLKDRVQAKWLFLCQPSVNEGTPSESKKSHRNFKVFTRVGFT